MQTHHLFCVRQEKLKQIEEVDFEVCELKPENVPFTCDLCGFSTESKRVLRSHFQDNHTTCDTGQRKNAFNCPKDGCDKKFSKSDRLQAHLRTHEGKKPEVCPICGMELKTLRILKRHLETHNTERNQKCSYCEKAFKVSPLFYTKVQKN